MRPRPVAASVTAAFVAGLYWALPVAGSDAPAAADNTQVTAPTAPGAQPAPKREDGSGWDQTYLGWSLRALGFGYSFVFLALMLSLFVVFTVNVIGARRDHVVPIQLVESFESHLNERQYREAYEAAKQDGSVLGLVLSTGLGKLSAGYEQAVEAMQLVGDEENMKFEHRLSYMALIGTISPMVGLFGTVHGMIASFSVISNSLVQPRPSELAAGISTALFTTLLGLFIAIPAIASYSILRNRIHRLIFEVGILSEGLMSRFERVGPG
jgi:biopolymer transport protein ExbB